MIQPVNNHILIEPLSFESFIAEDKKQYQEVGIVRGYSTNLKEINIGDRVYFDSWLASKYPNPEGKKGKDFYWIVSWEDIKAIEHENEISK